MINTSDIVKIHQWEVQEKNLSKLPPNFEADTQKIINNYISVQHRPEMAEKVYKYVDDINVLRLKKITQYGVDTYNNPCPPKNCTENEEKIYNKIVALLNNELEEELEKQNENKEE